jgi:hypothetical protein
MANQTSLIMKLASENMAELEGLFPGDSIQECNRLMGDSG